LLKNFWCVFEPTSPRAPQTHDETEEKRGKLNMRHFVISFVQIFDMDIFMYFMIFCGVFEIPLPLAERPPKTQEKDLRGGGGGGGETAGLGQKRAQN
jgi:hypothetical protein